MGRGDLGAGQKADGVTLYHGLQGHPRWQQGSCLYVFGGAIV